MFKGFQAVFSGFAGELMIDMIKNPVDNSSRPAVFDNLDDAITFAKENPRNGKYPLIINRENDRVVWSVDK